MIGHVVGKYQILEKIGEGGMGSVYRAEHTVLGSPAAVKVLLPQWTQDAVVVDRFFHEAKAASAIRHVGIVEVFDYGRLPGDQAWIAMELLRGENLTEFFARHRGQPKAEAGGLRPAAGIDPWIVQQIAIQLLAALDAAHVTGVVHRDLKPDNIILVRDPGSPGSIRVKILDFGIAKLGDRFTDKAQTKGGTILGTPTYMAPEQCKGGSQVDARADLYALGCILFELLVGRPPFTAEGGGEIMAMHIYEPPPRMSQLAPHLPAELDALVARLLVKNPADRTPSAAYAMAALERIALPPVAGEVPIVGPGGGRAETYASPAADLATAYMPPVEAGEPGEAAAGLPRWVPMAVLLVALAIAAAAVFVIGGSGADLPAPR